jgi:putative SOS response-associated peptidase YedK
MCGRYALDTPPAKLASYFDLDEVVDYPPRYNIPPGTDIPVIMEPIHDRMPVTINPNAWEAWLEAPAGDIAHLVRPYDADEMQAWPVSRRVNKTVEDDVRMIAPVADEAS